MSKYYIYKMEILENDTYYGVYIGQHKIGSKDPSCDGYKGSGSKWKKYILQNHIPVKKTILKLCDNIDESNYWEQYYMEQAERAGEYLWNVAKGGGNHESDRIYTEEEIKEHNKERFARWYEKNKEHHAEYRKQYYEKNKERIYIKKKIYSEENKEYYKEYRKQYYQKNKEELNKRNKEYYEANKEHLLNHMKQYQEQYKETHKEQLAEKNRKYYETHKEQRKKYLNQPCIYEGKNITFGNLIQKLRRQQIPKPTDEARKYLIA